MVYDAVAMRSIVALALAALILAAHAPGMFTETPVCAAVDGTRPALATAVLAKAKRPKSPSCCGSASCPMHAKGCGQTAACTMEAAYGPDAKIASSEQPSGTKLCAPSCGREGTRVAPGVPDPGTVEPGIRPEPVLAGAGCSRFHTGEPPARNPDPAVPPPRS
jgi:type IV secretory pathway TrbL component